MGTKNILSEGECPFCGEEPNVVDYYWDDGVLVLEMKCEKGCGETHKAYYKAEYLVSKIESDDEDDDEVIDDELNESDDDADDESEE